MNKTTPTVFISYSNQDAALVASYFSALTERGLGIFYDRNILSPGQDFAKALTDALNAADVVLVFLTENSMASSNVQAEIGIASNYLRTTPPKKLLIPLVSGSVKVPYMIEGIQRLFITDDNLLENVEKILVAIEAFMTAKDAADPATASSTSSTTASTTSAPAQSASPDNAAPNSATPNSAAQPGGPTEPAPIAPQSAGANAAAPPPSSTSSVSTGYWLIKINDSTWSIADFQPGLEYYLNTRQLLSEYTNDRPLYSDIKVGDKLAAYAYDSINAIVAVFEVTRSLHEDPSLGEVIKTRVSRVILPAIPLDRFKDKITFSGSLGSATNEKLFPLTRETFNAITGPVDTTAYNFLFNKKSLTRVATDSPAMDIEDQLGFTADVESLAAVIAYTEFQPPLAIGLFGNWGSGKSFFMNKLERQIKNLSQSNDATYCRNIIPVHFNSWHYSDSNLWASIITRIFDELKARGESSNETEKVSDIFSKLNSTLQLKAETEGRKEMIDKEIELLNDKKEEVEQKIKTQAENLNSLSILDIARAVFNDEGVQKDIAKVKEEFAFVQLDELKDIEASYQELNKATTNLNKGLGLVYSMRRGKLGWALLIAFAVWLGTWLLITKVAWFKEAFGNIKAILVPGTVVLTQFMIFVRPGLQKINKAYERVAGLKRTVQAREDEETKKANQEREKVRAELELAKTRQLELTQQIAQLETQSQLLTKEITDIASGKKLESFITSRVTDSRYTNSLGIISWIRKDFEELDKLLQQQRQAIKELDKHPGKKPGDFFLIDRIVLYIDDLDRCEADIVVRVLEAIHLLLAFPLFVVIVGVDPRWMHNALNLKYKDFLQSGAIDALPLPPQTAFPMPPQTVLPLSPDPVLAKTSPPAYPAATTSAIQHLEANSYDYLEKIFQVPFVLKPMDDKGKRQLIQSQFTSPTPPSASPPIPPAGTIPAAPPNPQQPAQIPASPTGSTPIPPGTQIPAPSPVTGPAMSKEELLKISPEEIAFMEDIAFLIGESPRTVKRFINIYRIIRTHDGFRYTQGEEYDYYCATLIVLAIMTGAPDEAGSIFKKIMAATDQTLFSSFLAENSDCQCLTPFSAVDRAPSLALAGNIVMVKFKVNFDLVCRFSFRDFS